MERAVELEHRSFSRPSPYLDGARTQHVSDFKYTRYQNQINGSVPTGAAGATDSVKVERRTKIVDKKTIGIALYGLGRAGVIHLGNLMINPRVSLVYTLESDQARYDAMKERWGDRMPPNVLPADSGTVLADPRVDAVMVATPTHTHFDIIQQALLADKLVFSEKPIGENEQQARRCYQLAEQRGLSVFCAFNRRFDPALQTVRSGVRRGDVGVVHTIKTVARDSPLPSIDFLRQSGGIFHDCAVHDIDLICWILGQFPLRVLASASAHVPEIAALGDHDTAAIVMEFEGGTIGSIDLSRNAVYGYDQRTEVGGTSAPGCGIFHDCAVHDIDLICWILGQFPLRVLASASAHVPEIAALGDHDTAAIVMEFEGGTIGSIDLSRNAVYGYDQRTEVFGPGGLLTAGNERPVNVHHLTSGGETAVPFYFSFPSRYSESYANELDSFLDYVQGKIPLPIRPEDSLRVSQIASACEESLRTRAFVELDYESAHSQ
ncbi:putative oxidoreductase YrbE [Amphibalanus amphitrite]|uniref:Putative oxidoreductase YrbE n=1 Tax=Amphibalanus amphitrite TaxID=1232801 RepID=A0A6A4XEL6_AMPAM|nr:putative oxidoreductase YrbE [Amphibalanus amphitrite]